MPYGDAPPKPRSQRQPGAYGSRPKTPGAPARYGVGLYPKVRTPDVERPGERPVAEATLGQQQPGVTLPVRHRIKGRRASDLEWQVYQAAKRLRWTDRDIQFQVDVLGGQQIGGAVLDFIFWAFGIPVIFEPNGDYWHADAQKAAEDRQRENEIRKAWRGDFRYVAVYGSELQTPEQIEMVLLKAIGYGPG